MLNEQKILYALKNGVVPDVDLSYICAGRSKELDEFNRCLDLTSHGSSIVKFITGSYGTGKSFLLSIVKQMALEKNYIVSSVKIDNNFKFNKGEQFYYEIMHNLTIKSSGTNGTSFEEIFNIWINKLQENKTNALKEINKVISVINDYNSSFATAFMAYIKSKIKNDIELSNAISGWIKGEKNIPAKLKSQFNIKSDIDKTNYLSFFRGFIKLSKLLGYSGILILVDEMELIVNERVNIRRGAYESLRNLIDMSSSGEINNCMIIFAGTNELFENEEKGLKTYAALFKRITSSYDMENEAFRDLRQPVIKIKGLGAGALYELTWKIIKVHEKVYNWEPNINDNIIKSYSEIACCRFGNKITEANTREYLKKIVDCLDIMEQNPGTNLFEEEVLVSKDIIEKRLDENRELTIIDNIIDDPMFNEGELIDFV